MKNFIKYTLVLSLLMINSAFAEREIRFNESLLPYKNGILIPNYGSEHIHPRSDEFKGYILYYKNNKLQKFLEPDRILKHPTALAVYNNSLFICNGGNLLIYNLADLSQKPQKIFIADGATTLNDMALSEGMLYITITDKDAVYRINLKENVLKPEKWIDIPSPNGIVFYKNSVYIASIPSDYANPKEDNVIYFIKNKNNPVPEKFNNIPRLYDGLAISKDGKSLYVSDWSSSSVFEINTKTKQEKTIYREKALTPADIGIKGNKLLIPDMTKHRIIVLDLKTGVSEIIENSAN